MHYLKAFPPCEWIKAITLFIILLLVNAALGEQPPIVAEENRAYAQWCESAKRLSAVRLTYTHQKTPTPEFVARNRNKNLSGDGLMIIGSVGSRQEGTLRVSRSGESMHRNEVLERFEDDLKDWKFNPNAADAYPAEPDTMYSYVEIHGNGIFFHFYPHQKRGAIWSKWDDRPDYPVALSLPPDPATAKLVHAGESENILDFDTDGKILTRYHLDPDHGMMPSRIEYNQILEAGGLFIFRFYTVEKFTRTESGAFLPAESTVHDFARKQEDGTIRVDKTYRFSMTAYEENVQFVPEEFTYEFPKGTFVRDNRTKTQYTVGKDETESKRAAGVK